MIKIKPFIVVILALSFFFIYILSQAYAQDDSSITIDESGVYDFEGELLVSQRAPAIIITADDVTLKNVKFELTGEDGNGVDVRNSSNITLKNITITGPVGDSSHGIFVTESSSVMIDQVNVTNVRDGIYIDESDDVVISNVTGTQNRYGIHLMYSTNIEIQHSEFFENQTSIMAMVSENLRIKNNHIHSNATLHSQGLISYQNDNVSITNNEFNANLNAISIQDSTAVFIEENNIYANQGAFHVLKSDPNITHNMIFSNIRDLVSDATLTNISENYYDAPGMIDLNEDGYGDTPMQFDEGMNQVLLETSELQFYGQGPLGFFLDFLDSLTVSDEGTVDAKPLMYE